ncbi:MAG TPA: M48 family metallopeptidase [Blastocatellia bacterium]|nr:M48 family metallopeptidase [Blastocatellia bacterium]
MRAFKPCMRLLGVLLTFAIMTAQPAALAANDKEKAADAAAKPTEPLGDKDNPLLIGKRNINKGSIDFYSLEREVKLGRQLAAEVDRTAKFVTDPVINEYVNRIGQNIVLHSDAKVPFTIKVIDSMDVNAFALPGGFLYVNSGVLLAADDEAEVAGVMAHEIGHVAARHGVEQASKGVLAQYLSIPLIFIGGPLGAVVQNVANFAVPLTFLKFSRGAEAEADRLGLQYMWAAGYDPTALLSFFEKLKAKEKKEPGRLAQVFSTHPTTGDRLDKARLLLTRFPDREEYTLTTSEFQAVKGKLLALYSAQKLENKGKAAPTLRRKPREDDASDDDTKDKPTLKRKNGGD